MDLNYISHQQDDDMVVLSAGAVGFFMFMADDEDFWRIYQNRRQHRFWTHTWCQSRDDYHQTNTVYKLQKELLQVSLKIFMHLHNSKNSTPLGAHRSSKVLVLSAIQVHIFVGVHLREKCF